MNQNLAARAGRWSAQHRKKAIIGWLLFVVIATVAGGQIGTSTLDDEDYGSGDSRVANQALDDAFPDNENESVLVQSKSADVDDPAFKAAVADVVSRVSALDRVDNVESPYARENAGLISEDRHSALVTMEITGDDAEDYVHKVLAATKAAQEASPQLRIEQFGSASADKALTESFEDDFAKAETTALPITLLILLIAFGALVAALMPLLLGITAVVGTLGLLAPISQIFPQEETGSSVVLLIGLAVGVDYTMFYLRREREERAAGRDAEAALQAAAATSGRAVLVAGLTVMIAMAGMFITGDSTFSSFAVGTMLVVAVAVVGSLTFVPATLSKLGDRVEKGRIPFLHRERAGESRFWNAVLDRVLRRPLVSAVASAAVLLALCVPVLGLHTALPGLDTLPRDLEVVQTYDRMQEAFPGEQIPAVVAVKADDVTTPRARAAFADLREQALATGKMHEPIEIDTSADKSVARITLPVAGDGTDDESTAALDALRHELVPDMERAIGGPVSANVTGMTAETEDFNSLMKARVPWVFVFVLTLAFLLLLVTFRSIVIPIKAILLNLLSVGAAYGLLVLVFQEGWGESLLGFESTGAIASWLPLFLFVVLFGLSMDYHVFILSRVREAFDRGMTTDEAVAHGIKTTASVVTSAAVVMVAVFAIFATLSAIEFKQMGIGLAAAVLIDATIIRAVLLPATMKLLGDWNWYLPRSLSWLPRITSEPEPARA